MSGEQVSGVIAYGVQDGETYYKRRFAFPNIRIQPNDTHGTYQTESSESPISFAEKEIFERVEWDGVLSVYAHAGELKVIRRFFPSATLPVFYERVELYNGGTCALAPEWAMCRRLQSKLACEGYVYFDSRRKPKANIGTIEKLSDGSYRLPVSAGEKVEIQY